MATIRKTFCIDNSRSHRNGLLPFVPYNEGETDVITYVTPGLTNGNYGQFVCDFGLIKGYVEEVNGIKINRKFICKRLKYLDVLRWYNFIQDRLIRGTKVKMFRHVQENVTNVKCGEKGNEYTIVSEVTNKWREGFTEWKSQYEFTLLDSDFFVKNDDGYYVFERPENCDDDRYNQMLVASEKADYGYIVDDYDTIIEYNKKWEEKWEELGGKTNLHADYDSDGVKDDFLFCYDFDKYILGKVEVPEEYNGMKIEGSRVPKYVYYTSFNDYKVKLQTYSANTSTDKGFKYKFDELGGDAFYQFLSSIQPKWITAPEIKEDGDYFGYLFPEIEYTLAINNDVEDVFVYSPYEYSASGTSVWDATEPYDYPREDIITSAYTCDGIEINETKPNGYRLRPSFETFKDEDNALVESKLKSLYSVKAVQAADNIFGIYTPFSATSGSKGKSEKVEISEVEVGQLFKCTYMTGWSSTPATEVLQSGYTIEKTESGEEIKTDIPIKKIDDIGEIAPYSSAYQVINAICTSARTLDLKPSSVSTEEIDGKTYYYQKYSGETEYFYEWWDCEKVDWNPSIKCADGELVEANQSDKYQNATIVACIPYLVPNPKYNDFYYIMAKYTNGLIEREDGPITQLGRVETLKPPFKVGEKINPIKYDDGTLVYDTIISSAESGTNMVIEYAMGVTEGNEEKSGIHYREVIPYYKEQRDIVSIDGVCNAELYYDYLDFDAVKEKVYSSDFKLYRETSRAQITGMEVCTQWTESGAVNAMLFTKDSTDGLQDEPKFDINLSFDRGNGAAWESHFKLSECNTMNDLKSYNNNFFNLS